MNIQQAILANPNATDAEILALVNAPVAKKIDLPSVRRLLAKEGTDVVIDDNRTHANEQIAYLCKRGSKFMTLIFRDDMVQLGEDHEQFMQLAGGLLQAGIVSGEIYGSLSALAFDFPEYTLAEVAWARHSIAVSARKQEVSQLFDAMNAAIDAVEVGGALPTLAALREVTV